jgi:hypothetical protein
MTSVVTASSTDVALALHNGMESLHNATVFTDLQAGAMLAEAVLLTYALAHLVMLEVMFCKAQRKLRAANKQEGRQHEVEGLQTQLHAARRLMWGFWPVGFDVVAEEPDGSFALTKVRPWCCCCGLRWKYLSLPAASLQASAVRVQPHRLGVGAALGAVTMAFMVGVFCHFLPCAVYSCDWGPQDNVPLRAGLWFGVWAVMAVVLLLTRQHMLVVRLDEDLGGTGENGAKGPSVVVGGASSPSQLAADGEDPANLKADAAKTETTGPSSSSSAAAAPTATALTEPPKTRVRVGSRETALSGLPGRKPALIAGGPALLALLHAREAAAAEALAAHVAIEMAAVAATAPPPSPAGPAQARWAEMV